MQHYGRTNTYKETKRIKLEKLRGQLEMERASFESQWRELSEVILPRRSRFFTQDRNRGDKRYTKIIDSTATMAAQTLASGMMAGITSPARPWFKLSVSDPFLAELWQVKEWLDHVTEQMQAVMIRSNLYNSLPALYADLGTFLTSAMMIEEDEQDVVVTHVFPVGSYYISSDARQRVNVFMRKYQMTVRQIVDEFGRKGGTQQEIDWEYISPFVRNQWEVGQTETWIEIIHFITPNEEYDPNKLEAKYKKYSSCYYENSIGGGNVGASGYGSTTVVDSGLYLKESGYDYFPVLCPRWSVTGEDIYGTDGPGVVALGDTRALQIQHKRKAQAIEKQINPPMNAPGSMRNSKLSVLPGEVNYMDPRSGDQGFAPAYQINFNVATLENDIIATQRRIQRAYHEDTFRMLIDDQRAQRATAAEVYAKQQERMLDLGPVLEQLNQDLLDPTIDIYFDLMLKRGMIPPPPQELSGQPLKVEYVSIMAQAQKAQALGGYERFAQFAGQLGSINPQVFDKINFDNLIDRYGDMTGVANDVMIPQEEVDQARAQRAQAQAAQQRMQMIEQGAGAAKNLAQAPMGEDNALTRLIQRAGAGALTPNAA